MIDSIVIIRFIIIIGSIYINMYINHKDPL